VKLAPRCLFIALLFTATTARATITVVDDSGASVTLNVPARRIVTLAPHATELVYAAGAGAAIVGVIKGSDFPADARTRPVVGDAAALDLERIVVLAPDLIVTWPWTTPAQAERLRARGIAVFEADPREIGGIADDVERIGTLAGTQEAAQASASSLRARLASLDSSRNADPPLTVFYQVSDVPLFTLGGQHLVSNAELHACVHAAVLAAQPLAVEQVSAGQSGPDPGPAEPPDRLLVEQLGGLAVADQSSGAGLYAKRPVGGGAAGGRREPPQGCGRAPGRPGPGRRFDQLGQ